MSRFAKINEEVFRRYEELTGEEYRLYSAIVFHTFLDTGICRRNLRQMAMMHGFDYIGTTRRFKKLIKLGWCEKTDKGIRPLVGLNFPKNGTVENVDKNTTSEDEMLLKTQHDSCQKDNIDIAKKTTFENEMLSKRQHLFKGIIEPFKDQSFPQTTTTETVVTTSSVNNNHFSEFSIEECLRYVEIRLAKGERIETPHKFARWLYQSGRDDVFIRATLYPEKPEEKPVAPGEISTERQGALNLLIDCVRNDIDIADFEKWHTPEDWAWLKKELENYVG